MWIFPRKVSLQIFKIRKINIDQPLQIPQHLDFFISTAVVHHRDRKPLLFRKDQCFPHLRQKMSRRHQIDIVCLLCLQIQKKFCKVLHCDHLTALPFGNRPVLAERTSQGTAGKKHRPGAFFSWNTRFFPHMKGGPCYHDPCIHAAESLLTRQAIHAAVSRTEMAVLQHCL